MEFGVEKRTIEAENLVADERVQALLRAESMTPGAGREAVEVLMEDAELSLHMQEAQEDRIVLEGTLYCQAVYRQGEEMSARALTAQSPYSQVIDCPGVASGMRCRAHATVEHVEADYENGHMVFRASVSVRAQALQLQNVEWIGEIKGADGLETQSEEICSVKTIAETEAADVLREEVALPAALDARVALMDWHTAHVRKTAQDLGGVRVQGDVLVETLIGTGVTGRPVALVKVVMPFDRLVEMPDWLSADASAEAKVSRLSAMVQEGGEGEESLLKLEADLALCVRASGKDCAAVLTDAYATGAKAVDVTVKEAELCEGCGVMDAAEPFKGTLMLPEGAQGVGTVLAVRARPNLSQWTSADGYTTFEGVLEAGVLYLAGGGGRLCCARAEMPFSARCAGTLPDNAWACISASGAEATALMSDRLELRCMLSVRGEARASRRVSALSEATEAEPAPRRGGITLIWPDENATAWSIGRKYRLPVAKVLAANGGKDVFAPGKAIALRA